MPLLLLHGDHQVASRQHLHQLIQTAKSQGIKDIVSLDGKKANPTDIAQATQSASLFGSDKLVIIENLHRRPQSRRKQLIISSLKSLASPQSPQTVIWEDKPLTASQIKALGNPKHQLFKLPQTLFSFLDSFYPHNTKQCLNFLDQTLQTQTPELIFVMIVRQVRLMIQSTSDPKPKMAPWQLQKLSSQATKFGSQNLHNLHSSLLQLDIAHKTGNNMVPLAQDLFLLIAKYTS